MKEEIEKTIFPGLDVGKFLCALFILFYHYFSEQGELQGILEEALSLYAVAVALFMTISGFLIYSKLEDVKEKKNRWLVVKKQVERIYTIYLLWSIPYLAFSVSQWNFQTLSLNDVLWTVQGWVFKTTFSTIWFMPVLALGHIFTYLLTERLPEKIVIALAVVFYITGALLSTYKFVGMKIQGFDQFQSFSELWLGGARGWLFFAFPLIMVGRACVKFKKRFNPSLLFGLSIVCLILLIAEALLIRKVAGYHTGIDLAIMMVLTVFCICAFLICVSLPIGKYCIWLRNISTLVFMSQRLFLTVLPSLFHLSYRNNIMGYLEINIMVLLFSTGVVLLSRRVSFLGKLF